MMSNVVVSIIGSLILTDNAAETGTFQLTGGASVLDILIGRAERPLCGTSRLAPSDTLIAQQPQRIVKSSRGVTTSIDAKASADPSAAGTPVIAYPGHAIAPAGELVAIGLPFHPARPSLAELTGRDPPFASVRCAPACQSCGHRTHTGGHAATFGIADGKIEPGNSKIHGLAAYRLAEIVT
jgi:hypothetical protein